MVKVLVNQVVSDDLDSLMMYDDLFDLTGCLLCSFNLMVSVGL